MWVEWVSGKWGGVRTIYSKSEPGLLMADGVNMIYTKYYL